MTDKKLGESLEQLKAIMDKTNGAFSKTLYRCITEYEPQELDGMVFLGEQGKHPKMWMTFSREWACTSKITIDMETKL